VFCVKGHRFEENCVKPIWAFGDDSVMVQNEISTHRRTNLVILSPSRITAKCYVKEILRLHIISMRRQMGRNFILMYENARPHIASIVLNFLKENNIETLLHPSMSSNLSFIEYVWDMMERRL